MTSLRPHPPFPAPRPTSQSSPFAWEGTRQTAERSQGSPLPPHPPGGEGGTHSLLHGVTEGFLEGGHVVGHVRWVGELGGPVHEVIHGCPARIPMGEVKVAMALVVIAWGGNKRARGCHPEGREAAALDVPAVGWGSGAAFSSGLQCPPTGAVLGRQRGSMGGRGGQAPAGGGRTWHEAQV